MVRCRRSILYEGFPQGFPVFCAKDEWVQATPANCASLDFVWVRGKTPACLSKSLARLPFQGDRLYHACAARVMLQARLITYADLGMDIRGSGRLSQEVFRAPLDAIEAALPEDLRKAAVNQWLGSLMSRSRASRFTKEAPGGWDIFCRQRRDSLASYRPHVPGGP